MAPKTKKDRRVEAAEKRRKQIDALKRKNKSVQGKRKQDLKIKNLSRNLYETDSRGKLKSKKKKLSNIPVQERSAPVNKKARGLSSLGKNYKEQELALSKKATKRSTQINKARYPKMGTYKGESSTTTNGGTSTTTAKRGKSSIEAKNRARLGDARVDKLKAKNKDFQAMKKGKMTKAQFIKKYPNSQTAKKARK